MGELVAWIIGWDLILEYGVSVAAVAVGWGQYFNELLDTVFGITLPDAIASPPGEGGVVNVPAVFIVLAVAALLSSASARARAPTRSWCFIKLLVARAVPRARRHGVQRATTSRRSRPKGTDGVVTAASVIFFAYIGFDAISTSGEETRNPGRDLPIAILGSLAIATVLYIVVALVAIGALPFDQLDGRRGAARHGARRGRRLRLGVDDHLVRRAGRDHERRADGALRPDADHVRDVPRRPDAAALARQRAPADADAGLHHRRRSGS